MPLKQVDWELKIDISALVFRKNYKGQKIFSRLYLIVTTQCHTNCCVSALIGCVLT